MLFNIKRYLYSLPKRSRWFFCIFIFPAIYLIVKMSIPELFIVSQNVSISPDTPVAYATNPTGYGRLTEIVADSNPFFQNKYALQALYNQIQGGFSDYKENLVLRDLVKAVKSGMSLVILEKNIVQVRYQGTDEALGETVVGFFSQRLVHKGIEGLSRSKSPLVPHLLPKLVSAMETTAHRFLWRSNRSIPLIQTFLLSFLGVLIFLGILEWTDTSFKSDRQVARYLDIKILGSLPDLNEVYTSMGESQPS
jgi:hypothetical protein